MSVATLTERLESLHTNGQAIRLNLGAGDTEIPGFESVDRKSGQEVYPLDYADESVEEIRASHVLEHFSHLMVADVLGHWVSKLKPGGKIRLAVPDFELIARLYLAGKPLNVQGYTMGGHVDANDRHGVIFDRELLTELMVDCGLERIGPWHADAQDCSSLPISLNLQGFKPSGPITKLENVRAVYSTPRFGPLLHCRCIERAMMALHIEAKGAQSCFWHQMLSLLMEDAIADPACEFVLTMDYDTVFSADDVKELYRLMQACPEADAVFPLQSKRGCEQLLFNVCGPDGKPKRVILADLGRNLLPADTGHFGLTLIRAESLRKFPRPWMLPQPNDDGLWSHGQIDADITFWLRWKEAGGKFFLAPRVVVGHLEEMVKWPGVDLRPIYQATKDYEAIGIPAEVVR